MCCTNECPYYAGDNLRGDPICTFNGSREIPCEEVDDD